MGAARRMDDLAAHFKAIENDLAALTAQLGGQPRMDPQVVAERLGLTPGESRVAVALAEGCTVRDAAEAMGRKVTTVRWYLNRIYRKLDISTQAQLIRLVLLLPHLTASASRQAP